MNYVVSTEKGHKKASSTFQLKIYNDLFEFFLCIGDFSVSPFTLNHYYVASTAKNNFQDHIETDKRQFCSKESQSRVLTCDSITFFTDSRCTWRIS